MIPRGRRNFRRSNAARDDLCGPVLAGAGNPPMTFLQDYTVLGLCDLFSLVFCNGWREPHLMEGYEVVLEGDRLVVTPGSVRRDLRSSWMSPPGPWRCGRTGARRTSTRAWAEAEPARLTGCAIGARPAS